MAEQENNTNRRRARKPQPVDNTYGHLQPQALEVEKAVLGALMIDKDAYAVVCETLRPESFYEPRNQMVYQAIMELSMAERPVDILTVTEQLAKDGTLEEVGGPGYVAELSSRVASSANIEFHANIVAQKSLARQLIQFASLIETKAFDETIDVEDLMQEAEGSLFELSQRNMKKDYTAIDPVIAQAVKTIQNAAKNTDGLTGVSTGYYKLVPMAFFSLEMSNVQLVNRLISNACEIQGSKILNGQLQRDEWERLDWISASTTCWVRRYILTIHQVSRCLN